MRNSKAATLSVTYENLEQEIMLKDSFALKIVNSKIHSACGMRRILARYRHDCVDFSCTNDAHPGANRNNNLIKLMYYARGKFGLSIYYKTNSAQILDLSMKLLNCIHDIH